MSRKRSSKRTLPKAPKPQTDKAKMRAAARALESIAQTLSLAKEYSDKLSDEVWLNNEAGKAGEPSSKKYLFESIASEEVLTSFTGKVLFKERHPLSESLTVSYGRTAFADNWNGAPEFHHKDWKLTWGNEVLQFMFGENSQSRINEIRDDYLQVVQRMSKSQIWLTHFGTERAQNEYKVWKTVGPWRSYNCWRNCLAFIAFTKLPYVLCEGEVLTSHGDCLSGNVGQPRGRYFHSWLELDGMIFDPTVRNLVRHVPKQDRKLFIDPNDDFARSYESFPLDKVVETVYPVIRPDHYRAYVKRPMSEDLTAWIHSDLKRNTCSYSYRVRHSFDEPKKIGPSDQILEDPDYICNTFSVKDFKGGLTGDSLFGWNHLSHAKSGIVFMLDFLGQMDNPGLMDKLDVDTRDKINKHKDGFRLLAQNTSVVAKLLGRGARIPKPQWDK